MGRGSWFTNAISIFSFASLITTVVVVGSSLHGHSSTLASLPSLGSSLSLAQLLPSSNQSADQGSIVEPGIIHHPVILPVAAPVDPDTLVKARLDECASDGLSPIELPAAVRKLLVGKPQNEPMVIKNTRHGPLTLELEPPVPNHRSTWIIAPGATWKTTTHSGQRWLFADHQRCLFYATAGEEALRMVVKSQ